MSEKKENPSSPEEKDTEEEVANMPVFDYLILLAEIECRGCPLLAPGQNSHPTTDVWS